MNAKTFNLLSILSISISACSLTGPAKYLDGTPSIYSNLDTLKYYDFKITYEMLDTSQSLDKYFLNGISVNKKAYEKYDSVSGNSDKCRPCYLKIYNFNEKVVAEGVRYTDCVVGIWIEYYPNGKFKVIGHHKENETGNWDDIWSAGYCTRKEGLWTYFDENGEVTKTEKYLDGQIIE